MARADRGGSREVLRDDCRQILQHGRSTQESIRCDGRLGVLRPRIGASSGINGMRPGEPAAIVLTVGLRRFESGRPYFRDSLDDSGASTGPTDATTVSAICWPNRASALCIAATSAS